MEKKEIKIDLNKLEQYIVGEIKFAKRSYLIVNDAQDTDYFEVKRHDNEVYCTSPNQDLTLTGNMGDSLTHLNEQVIMQHIVENIKKDLLNNNLNGKEAISSFIKQLQIELSNEELVKMLFTPLSKYTEDTYSESIRTLISYFETLYQKALKRVEVKKEVTPVKFSDFYKEPENNVASNTKQEVIPTPQPYNQTKEDLDALFSSPLKNNQPQNEPIFAAVPPTINNEPISNPLPVANNINESTKKPIETNPLGVSEEELDDTTIEGMLLNERNKLNDDQVSYLKDLQNKRALKERMDAKQLDKGRQKVLQKPNKASAFVDIVLWALVAQLIAVGILILIVTIK